MKRTAWLVAPGLAMIAVAYGLARYAYGLFLPELRESLALDGFALGLIGAGSYAGYCVAIVVSLVFTARVGPRSMAVAAGAVAVVGTALIAVAPAAPLLAAGVLVAGLSSGLASPPMGEAVARTVVPAKQNRANALINSGTSVGVILSGPAALVAADQWRLAWAAFAAIGLAVLAWNAAVMPPREAPSIDGGGTSKGGAPWLSFRWLARPGALPLFAASAGIGFSSAAYWTFSRDLVMQVGGLTQTGSTVFWVVIGVSGIAGGVAGDLVGRFGLAVALRVTLLAMAAGTGVLGAAPGVPALVFASAAVFGAAYITLTGIALVWAVAVFHERPSAGLGSAFLILSAGQALGAPFAGILGDANGLGITFGVFAAVAVATAFVRPGAADDRAAPTSEGA